MDNFTIYDGPGRLHLYRTVHDDLKNSPIRRRLRALGDLCHGRSPRAKTHRPPNTPLRSRIKATTMRKYSLRRQPYKISRNEDMRRALLHTSRRRLAEANPHDNMWGIGQRACDRHASSTGTWCGSNLLGQILEHVRETLDRETMPQSPAPYRRTPQDP